MQTLQGQGWSGWQRSISWPDLRTTKDCSFLTFISNYWGAILVIANGVLDAAPAHEVRTVVTSQRCGGREKTIILRGASDLPDGVTLTRYTGACRDVEPGDSVFLSVKSGFFGWPWIQASGI